MNAIRPFEAKTIRSGHPFPSLSPFIVNAGLCLFTPRTSADSTELSNIFGLPREVAIRQLEVERYDQPLLEECADDPDGCARGVANLRESYAPAVVDGEP